MRKSLTVITLTVLWVVSAFYEEADSTGSPLAPSFEGQADVPKVLKLEDALRLALERNPQLRAAHSGVRAANGRLAQAGARLNPTLSAEVEDFGGSGEQRGFEAGQTTLLLEQTLELGGKRAARRRTASAEMKLAEWDRDARRLDVIEETSQRFIDVLAAQEELALSREAWQTAETIYQTVSNRVTAGKDSPVEEAKARVELALARLTVDRAGSRLAVNRTLLCALWGDSAPAFESVGGDLAKLAPSSPDAGQLGEAMTRSPEWARWADELRAAEAAVQTERRSRISDLTLGAGVRQSQAGDGQAFVAGIGMELPLLDRKRGAILAARAELERKRAEQETAQTVLRVDLAAAHELLTTLQRAAGTLAQDALPAAEQAFAAAQAAYANGKIGYLDVQDARRSLLETRSQQLEILADYHRAVARMERLAGSSLGEINQQ